MLTKFNNLTSKTVFVLLVGAVVLSLLAVGLESFFSEEYSNETNCSDFGTQEKAQHALKKDKGNLIAYRTDALDSDNDGRACEDNPKSSPMILVTFIGLFGALVFVEFKRVASLKDTDFLRKFLLPSLIMVYPVNFSVSQIRDRVLPSGTQAYVIYVLAFLVAYVPTYFVQKVPVK
jgi:hypothetical protein